MKHLAEDIQKAIKEKHVIVQKHPTADLWIHNYSQTCQYNKIWTEVTLQCRGLILDGEFNLVARPLKKFFNLGEIVTDTIPNEPFEITKKEDGSLGILYWINDVPYIATRGSFESDQAKKATEILHTKYSHVFDKFKRDRTYLFEIIYPQNRIVLDYAGMEDLIMIAIVDNETGMDLPLEDIGFPLVKRYDGITDINTLKSMEVENEEGFVVRFIPSNTRIKIKFSEYCRLHKILTQTSNIAIWENLRDGKPLDELLERIPDEFYKWVRKTKEDLEAKHKSIFGDSMNAYSRIHDVALEDGKINRKTFAIEVMKSHKDISGIIFNILDGKDCNPVIWKMLRPEYSKPFKTEI